MLAFIRKYQYSIMLVVAVFVILAFAWFYDPNRSAASAPDSVLSVAGKSYTNSQVQELSKHYQLSGGLGMYQMAQLLSTLDQRVGSQQGQVPPDYLSNLLVLRDQTKKLGLSVDQTAIEARIKELPAFQTNGGFDPLKYNSVTENLAGRGMTEALLHETVGDSLALEMGIDLVTAGIQPSQAEVDLIYQRAFETIDSSAFYFNRADHENVTVSEEELKTYFDENTADLLGPEQRQIRYVHFKEPAGFAEVAVEERLELDRAHKRKINDFSSAVVEPAADFGKIASSMELAVSESAVFSRLDLPEVFKEAPVLVEAIFARDLTHSAVSDPIPVNGDMYIFEVTKQVAPQPLSFEEAKEQITGELTQRKISDSLSAASQSARETIANAIKEGQDLATAAQAAGVTPVSIPAFTLSQPPADARSGSTLANLASELRPGEVSSVTPDGEGDTFLYVASKTPPAGDDAETKKTNIMERVRGGDMTTAITSWFQAAKDDANVKWAGN